MYLVVSEGDFTVDELRREALSSTPYFYIVINLSSESFVADPGTEYDILKDSADSLVNMYMQEYGQDIYVDMCIYYLEEGDYEYATEYFKTHITTNEDEEHHLHFNDMILVEFGSENIHGASHNLRLTRDEFIEIRERKIL